MATQPPSRLSRNLEKQSRKQLVIFLIGILVIIVLVVKFGVVVIEGVGNFAAHFNKNSNVNENHSVILDTPVPPTLSDIPSAVDTERITISGSTGSNTGQVELYKNDHRYSVASVKNSSFSFQNVKLDQGDNIFTARQVVNSRKSDFSPEYTVQFVKDPPKLEMSFPQDGAKLSRGDQEIDVRGSTDPLNTITVNSFTAIVDGSGNFSYRLKLNDGDNTIVIEATNPAGVKTNKEIKVTYAP